MLKKSFRLIIILLVAFLLMAPGSEGCPSCQVIQGFYEALDAGDVDTAMTYVAEDAVLWRVDNVAYRGEAEIREQLKQEVGTFSYQVGDIVADGTEVRYAWKMVSDRNVWTGMDKAIVQKGQILYSRLEVE